MVNVLCYNKSVNEFLETKTFIFYNIGFGR